MKNLIGLIGILLCAFASMAQTRYFDSLYAAEVTSDVFYGSNYNYDGSEQELLLDVYQPMGDDLEKRPLIIFSHGGSFLAGSKENPTVVELCTRFAQLGYVTVSMNYRLGVNYFAVLAGNGEEEFTYATLRGTHDMRAAIRFFRKDAATENLYRIDTTIMVAGGSSAGGFNGLHTAYLDELEEIPDEITNIEELGGIEGNSGNAGYSSKINAVINLCGAIGDTAWIAEMDTALISVHGSDDGTVPFGTGNVELFGIPVAEVHGSQVIDIKTQQAGVSHDFLPFYGVDHVPYDPLVGEPENELYMDSTFTFVRNSLYEMFIGSLPTNTTHLKDQQMVVYPNPSYGAVTIERGALVGNIWIYSIDGVLVDVLSGVANQYHISLPAGVYIISGVGELNVAFHQKIVVCE